MDLIEMVKDTADDALGKSKHVVGENAERINSVIDSLSSTLDSRTSGKYSERITKVATGAKDQVNAFGATPGSLAAAPIPDAEIVEP